ncbi:MAG: hypothetical protein ABSE58_03645 [Candidatus Limnocylindrales bacterium]|jgi:hypothetical protein
MIGYWHAISPDRHVQAGVAMGAHLGGHELIVERSCEGCWRWAVMNCLGHEIEGGTAPDERTAEEMAEDAAFHIHPPTVGDWVRRLI